MIEDFTKYPILIACLIFIIKILLETIKNMKSSKPSDVKGGNMTEAEKRDLYTAFGQVKDLHDWHAKEDADGRKVWYTPRSFEKSLEKHTASIDENTKVLRSLKTVIEQIERE